MKHALSVASECAPLVKTGGLADVAGALPGALATQGWQLRTLLPGYPAVMAKAGKKAREVWTGSDLMGGPARVLATRAEGLDLLVLDAPHLFDRKGALYLGAGRARLAGQSRTVRGAQLDGGAYRRRGCRRLAPGRAAPARLAGRARAGLSARHGRRRPRPNASHHPQYRLPRHGTRDAPFGASPAAMGLSPGRLRILRPDQRAEGGYRLRRQALDRQPDLCARAHVAGIRHGSRRRPANARRRSGRYFERYRRNGLEPRDGFADHALHGREGQASQSEIAAGRVRPCGNLRSARRRHFASDPPEGPRRPSGSASRLHRARRPARDARLRRSGTRIGLVAGRRGAAAGFRAHRLQREPRRIVSWPVATPLSCRRVSSPAA